MGIRSVFPFDNLNDTIDLSLAQRACLILYIKITLFTKGIMPTRLKRYGPHISIADHTVHKLPLILTPLLLLLERFSLLPPFEIDLNELHD